MSTIDGDKIREAVLVAMGLDEPNSKMANGLDEKVAHDAQVKDLFEQMCTEFQDRGYGAHVLIVPPRSSRVVAQAMARFKALHNETRVLFDACPDETDATDGHFVFVRRGLV